LVKVILKPKPSEMHR